MVLDIDKFCVQEKGQTIGVYRRRNDGQVEMMRDFRMNDIFGGLCPPETSSKCYRNGGSTGHSLLIERPAPSADV
jgi:hypothetical protein